MSAMQKIRVPVIIGALVLILSSLSVSADQVTVIDETTGLGPCVNLSLIYAYDDSTGDVSTGHNEYAEGGKRARRYRFQGQCFWYYFARERLSDEFPNHLLGGHKAKLVDATIDAFYYSDQPSFELIRFDLGKAAKASVMTSQDSDKIPNTASGIRSLKIFYDCLWDPWLRPETPESPRRCTYLSHSINPIFPIVVKPLAEICRNNPADDSPGPSSCGGGEFNITEHRSIEPLSRSGHASVGNYKNEIRAEKYPPQIYCPSPSGNTVFRDGMVDLDVRFLDPQLGFDTCYQYPQGADTVTVQISRWVPGPDGQSGTWGHPEISTRVPGIEHSKTYIGSCHRGFQTISCGQGKGFGIDMRGMEGRWRINAKHGVDLWPWSDPVEFWIGDQFDYSRPTARILSPAEGSVLTDQSDGLFRADFVASLAASDPKSNSNPTTSQTTAPPTSSSAQVAVQAANSGYALEWQLDWYQVDQNGQTGWLVIEPVTFETASSESHTLYLNRGRWRVRARPKYDDYDGPRPPWTAWQYFVSGTYSDPKAGNAANITSQIGNAAQSSLPEVSVSVGTTDSEADQPGADKNKTIAAIDDRNLGSSIDHQTSTGINVVATPHGVDLTVDNFWLESTQVDSQKVFYFNWRVRNVGNAKASASQVNIVCAALGAVPCPGLANPFSVPPLSQKFEPETDGSLLLSAHVISVPWPEQVAPGTGEPAHFKFTVTADANGVIAELVENNNSLVSDFVATQSGRAAQRVGANEEARFGASVDKIIGGESDESAVDTSRPTPDMSLAAKRLPSLEAVESETPDSGDADARFSAANTRSQIAALSSPTVISPRSGSTIQGDLVVRVSGADANTPEFAVSFEHWDGNTWRPQAIRGFDRMRRRNNALIVPRQQFSEGGRWRVCVHAAGEDCPRNDWNEFSFAARTGTGRAVQNRPRDVLESIDPSLILQPQDDQRRAPQKEATGRAEGTSATNEERRAPGTSRVTSPDVIDALRGIDNPTRIGAPRRE